MRKLVVVLLVLGVLAAVADEAARRVAQAALASQVRTSASLKTDPSVSVGGWPFLLQALRGEYSEATVTARGVDRGGVRVEELDIRVEDAKVPLGDALSGSVSAVPVRSLSGTALVSYVDLASRSDITGLRVEPAGSRVRVTGRLTVLGVTVSASADSDVSLRGSSIVLKARSLKVLGQSSPAVVNALAGRLDLVVPIGQLPYGLRLTDVTVSEAGLRVAARSGPTVLTARS